MIQECFCRCAKSVTEVTVVLRGGLEERTREMLHPRKLGKKVFNFISGCA
jgi:hypothetical protein